jgi:hypothetical protein
VKKKALDKIIKNICTTACVSVMSTAAEASYFSAEAIYEQAAARNDLFFEDLAHTAQSVDTTDSNGDTAYCLALWRGDRSAQNMLVRYGADQKHECTSRFETVVRQSQPYQADLSASTFSINPTYLVGGAAVVGVGVAFAAGGGGGGGGGSASTNSSSTVGDSTPITGGTTSSKETALTAADFITSEYLRGGFLSQIKAAEAYAQMYYKDSSGNLVSHQANSDAELEKVLVGVLDAGVYPNTDIQNKITGSSAQNEYQSSTYYGYIKDGLFYVVVKTTQRSRQQGQYVDTYNVSSWTITSDKTPESSADNLTKDELQNWLANLNLKLDDFSLMNKTPDSDEAYQGYPGANLTQEDTFYDAALSLSHGTHIAGIIAAEKNDSGMHGVAFENAEIYAASWDMNIPSYSIKSSITALVDNMLSAGVQVINNSWGTDSTSYSNAALASSSTLNFYVAAAYVKAVSSTNDQGQHDVVWVQSTGNNYNMSEPQLYAGLGLAGLYEAGDYEAPIIAVTALGQDGTIASYANYCGSTAQYCLAAPGTQISSTVAVDEGTWTMSGTSMATPVVSGSIALLRGYYPWLSSQNIAYLLLNTADNKGIYSDSAIYGRGLLDLNAAVTTPLGNLSLPTTDSVKDTTSLTQTRLYTSGVLGVQMLKAMPESLTVFDVLERPFSYKTENLVTTTHFSKARLKSELAQMRTSKTVSEIGGVHSGLSLSSTERPQRAGMLGLSDFEIRKQTDNEDLRLYYASQSRYADERVVWAKADNPYFAMNEAYGAEKIFHFSKNAQFSMQFQTGENGLYERDQEEGDHRFDHRAYVGGATYTYNVSDRVRLGLVGGLLSEDDAVLGMNGSGVWQSDDTQTYYTGLKLAVRLNPKTMFRAVWHRGYTQDVKTALWQTSGIETESFGFSGEYQATKETMLGMSFGSPLSVIKGVGRFRYATGRDAYSDTVYFDESRTSLKASAREYDLSLYGQTERFENLSLTAKAEIRLNADFEPEQTDYLGLVGVQYRF